MRAVERSVLVSAVDDAQGALAMRASGWGRARAYVELAKPGVTRLVVVTAWLGAVIAPGAIPWPTFLASLVGTTLVVMGANALNMVLERDTDRHMERTCMRPLPTGRVSVSGAATFGALASLLGLLLLVLRVNAVSALLAAAALVTYVGVYTPLKRVTPWALHVGAIPGAVPPLIGWASVTGSVNLQALSLFLLMFLWQLPHFAAIAVFRRADYARAGLKVLSVVHAPRAARWAIVRYSALLVAGSVVPVWVGLGGLAYWLVAFSTGAAFLGWAVLGLRPGAGDPWARILFFASMPYLVALFAALALTAHC